MTHEIDERRRVNAFPCPPRRVRWRVIERVALHRDLPDAITLGARADLAVGLTERFVAARRIPNHELARMRGEFAFGIEQEPQMIEQVDFVR